MTSEDQLRLVCRLEGSYVSYCIRWLAYLPQYDLSIESAADEVISADRIDAVDVRLVTEANGCEEGE